MTPSLMGPNRLWLNLTWLDRTKNVCIVGTPLEVYSDKCTSWFWVEVEFGILQLKTLCFTSEQRLWFHFLFDLIHCDIPSPVTVDRRLCWGVSWCLSSLQTSCSGGGGDTSLVWYFVIIIKIVCQIRILHCCIEQSESNSLVVSDLLQPFPGFQI